MQLYPHSAVIYSAVNIDICALFALLKYIIEKQLKGENLGQKVSIFDLFDGISYLDLHHNC